MNFGDLIHNKLDQVIDQLLLFSDLDGINIVNFHELWNYREHVQLIRIRVTFTGLFQG